MAKFRIRKGTRMWLYKRNGNGVAADGPNKGKAEYSLVNDAPALSTHDVEYSEEDLCTFRPAGGKRDRTSIHMAFLLPENNEGYKYVLFRREYVEVIKE